MDKWRSKYHTKKFIIYLLPKHNYVGATSCFNQRLADHRRNNKDTTDWRILIQTDCVEDASNIEDYLHSLGFNGAHWQGLKFIDTAGLKHIELPNNYADEDGLYW